MIGLSCIIHDLLNPNQLCGNPSQCEGFETTKKNWTHTVSPFLAFVLLPKVRDFGSNRSPITVIMNKSARILWNHFSFQKSTKIHILPCNISHKITIYVSKRSVVRVMLQLYYKVLSIQRKSTSA